MRDTGAVFTLGLSQGVSTTFFYSMLGPMLLSYQNLALGSEGDPAALPYILASTSCYGLGQVVSCPLWGWNSDRVSPRVLFNLCLGWSTAAWMVFGMASSFAVSCAALFAAGLANGTGIILVSLMADVMNKAADSGTVLQVTVAQLIAGTAGSLLASVVAGVKPIDFGLQSEFWAAHPFLMPCIVVAVLNVVTSWSVMQGDVGLRTPPEYSVAEQGFLPSVRLAVNGEQAVVLTTLAGCSVTQALGPAVVAEWMAAVLQVDGATLLPYSLGTLALTLAASLLLVPRIINRIGYRDASVACGWFAVTAIGLQVLAAPLWAGHRRAAWVVLVVAEAAKRVFLTCTGSSAMIVGLRSGHPALQGTLNGLMMSGIGLGTLVGHLAGIPASRAFHAPAAHPVLRHWPFLLLMAGHLLFTQFSAKLDPDPERIAQREKARLLAEPSKQ
eukprot:EG_transcript_9960